MCVFTLGVTIFGRFLPEVREFWGRRLFRSVTAAPTSSREVGAALPCCRISQGETTRPKKEGESLPTSIPSDRPDRWKLLVDRHDQLR